MVERWFGSENLSLKIRVQHHIMSRIEISELEKVRKP